MAQTSNRHDAPSTHRPKVVSDLDHTLATATIVLGVVGLLLIALGATVAGTWCGVVGMVCALWGQMVSTTRTERWVDMIGLLVAFLAVAIGAAEGGLY